MTERDPRKVQELVQKGLKDLQGLKVRGDIVGHHGGGQS